MDDKSWNDYLTGLNTGVAFGIMGELGRSHRYEPPPPVSTVLPPPGTGLSDHAAWPVLPGPGSRSTPSGRSYPPSWLDRWLWGLAGTLTSGFDGRVAPILESRYWRWTIIAMALGFGFAALAAFPPEALSDTASSWTTEWFVLGAIAFGLGAFVGAMTLPLLFMLVRGVIWTLGAVVTLVGALVFIALVVGGFGLAIYGIAWIVLEIV